MRQSSCVVSRRCRPGWGAGRAGGYLRPGGERARERGQAVLVGRSTPTDRVSPLRPLGEALLDGLRDRRPPDDPALAPYLPALGTLVPHWARSEEHTSELQ